MHDNLVVIEKKFDSIRSSLIIGMDKKSILDGTCLFLLTCYLFALSSYTTTFYFFYPINFENFILGLLVVCVVAKVVLFYKNRLFYFALVFSTVYYLAWRDVGYRFLLFLAVLTIGLAGIDYRKIMSCYLVSVGSITVGAILASLSGAIKNLAYNSAKRGIRSSWGIGFPTDFATGLFYILMIAFALFLTVPDILFIPLCLLVMAISMFVANSLTTSICCGLFTFIVIMMSQYKRMDDGRELFVRNRRLLRTLAILIYPMCAAFVFFLIYLGLHGHISLLDFNEYTHARMSLSVEAVKNYGIKPFGTAFDQIGAGGSTISDTRYNFVDSTYPLILIRYGWVTFISVSFLWIYMVIKVIKSGNKRLAAVMAVIAIHSVSEHHFPEINYNILLAMPFADFGISADNSAVSFKDWIGSGEEKRKKIIQLVVAFIGGVLAFGLMPITFSYLRTAFNGHGYSGSGNREIKVLIIVLAILLLYILLVWSVGRVLAEYQIKRTVYRSGTIIAGICAVSLMVIMLKTSFMIDQVREWNINRISEDSYALGIVKENANGKIFVNTFPEAYARDIGGISRSIFNGEDLAGFDNVTVVVDRSLNSPCFSNRGFLYLPISEYSAIYTNDQGAIEGLENEGFILKGYCSYEKNVDMWHEGEINTLEMTPEGMVTIDGPEHSLIYGPYDDINPGPYTVTYVLKIDPVEYKDDYQVLTLKVNTYWGQNTIAQKAIYRSYFDEDGRLAYELPISIGSGKAVEFLAFAEAGQRIGIESISYARTPKYDVHFTINKEGLRTHEEYYTLEGEPFAVSNGSYGSDYEYDKDGNVIDQKFLDSSGNLFLIDGGYAEVKRIYEKNRLVSREEYYGTDGKPIALSNGRAGFEREYDKEGNILKESSFGVNSEAILLNGQYYKVAREYDDDNRIVKESYFGIDESPILLTNGYASFDREYDENGNVHIQRFYDTDGKRCITTWGYSSIVKEYDDQNRVIREEYQDIDDELIALSGGQAIVEREYDGDGNVTVERYYDTDCKPHLLSDNYFMIVRAYNSGKQNVHEEYYGTDEKLILLSGGYAGIDREYDINGNVSFYNYLGLDGKPVITIWNYAGLKRDYDEKRQITREEYYDENGKNIALSQGQAAVEYEYDDAGNRTVYRYYDVDNNPVLYNGAYWKLKYEINDKRQVVREDYYGLDGNPIALSGGQGATLYEYDEKGNKIVVRYYDVNNQPVLLGGVYGYVKLSYNEDNKVTKKTYYNLQDEIVSEEVVEQ